jgi:DNA polymerase-3 subunit gamma/tau
VIRSTGADSVWADGATICGRAEASAPDRGEAGVRIGEAADIEDTGAVGAARAPQPTAAPTAAARPVLHLATFAAIVALAGDKRDLALKAALETDVRLVAIEDGRLEIALERSAARTLVGDLARKLEHWSGRRWTVIVSNAEGAPTLRAQAEAARDKLADAARAHPHVQAVLARWPGAVVERVERSTPEAPADGDAADAPLDGEDDD